MITLTDRFVQLWYAVMRVVFGVLFFLHGTQKALGFPPFDSGPPRSMPVMSLPWVAGIIESITGPLIAMGLWSGPAAFLASGEMACAYFLSHAPRSIWPTNNVGEAAIFNCLFFLYVAAKGPGMLSLDHVLRGKVKRHGVLDSSSV